MAKVKITDKKLRAYIEEVMKPAKKEVLNSEEAKEYTSFFVKKIDAIMDFAKTHHTQVTPAAKGTVWGAYNAISGFLGWEKDFKSQEDKMSYLYFKAGAKTIEKAFAVASQLI